MLRLPPRAAARVVLLALAALAPRRAPAATLAVPGQYATIQAALTVASNGDVIQVAAGTYYERLTLSGKANVTLQGAGPGSTTLSGSSGGTTLTISNSSTVTGFTITGGNNPNYDGGGILVTGGSPVIDGNVIAGNIAGNGAGIALQSGAAVVRNNVIRDNLESCGSGCSGGGIQVGLFATTPQITGNLVEGNSSEEGAGIEVATSGTPLIQGNVVRGNVGRSIPGGSLGGEGIHVRWANAKLVGNLVVENAGGGIIVDAQSARVISIVNDTVAMNGGSTGSALLVNGSGGTIQVVNGILVGGVACAGTAAGSVSFASSDLYAGGGAPQTGCTLAAGNLTADPAFVDLGYGNYRLQPGSPAVDAGATLPAGVNLPVDLDGDPRVQNAKVDLGAYEYQGLQAVTVSALALDFGAQRVGTPSAPRTITVTNGGASALQVSDVGATGDYAFTTTCRGPDGVAPGASCTIAVTFQPTARFARTGTLTLRGNVAQVNGVPATPAGPVELAVALGGTGLAPHVVLSGATLGAGPALAYGQQRVGIASAAQRVVVTNDGELDLTVSAVTAPAPFAAAPAGCAVVPANGGTCTVDVTFAPVARGTFAGPLSIASDAIGAPSTVALGGQGIAPVAVLSSTAVSFPDQRVGDAAPPAPVTLSNAGDAPLDLAAISVQGAAFAQVNDCPAVLAAGASCTLQVSFAPAASGTQSGAVGITHDAIGGSSTVALTGEAVDFTMALYPGSYTLPAGQPASLGLVLTRSGNAAFGWPVALTCSGAPPGASCTFTPSSAVTPGWQTQVTVRISTPLAQTPTRRGGGVLALLALPVVLLAGSRRRGAPWALVLAIALAAGTAVACGSGPPLGHPGGGGGGGRGTYDVKITATSGALTHTATVQLVFQ